MIIPNKESRSFLKKMGAFTWLTAVALGLYGLFVLGASTMLVGNILLVGVIAFVLSLAVSVLLFRYPLLESVALAYVMYASVDLAAFLPSFTSGAELARGFCRCGALWCGADGYGRYWCRHPGCNSGLWFCPPKVRP